MGLFDQIMGGGLGSLLGQSGGLGSLLGTALGGNLGENLPGLVDKALAKTPFGSLQGLLDQLQSAGLGDQVSSWLGSGPNAPVSADQLAAAIGNTQLGEIASSLGLSADALPGLLAQYLPTVVDKLSPDGVLKSPGA